MNHRCLRTLSLVQAVRTRGWRTWNAKTILPDWTGAWMVEVLSEYGTALACIIFFVQ